MKDRYYERIRKMYEGKRFRYNSKYGSSIENVLCYRVVIRETIKLEKRDWVSCPAEIVIISDKGNSYLLTEVEFYNK